MKVVISGSRRFGDIDFVERVMKRLLDEGHTILVGDAKSGVDRFVNEVFEGAEWTEGYPSTRVVVFEADWRPDGTLDKGAGFARNRWMVGEADMLVAIFAPGPRSPGTAHALSEGMRRGIPCHVYHEGEWSNA